MDRCRWRNYFCPNVCVKNLWKKKHQTIYFKIKKNGLLRLHKKYNIFSHKNPRAQTIAAIRRFFLHFFYKKILIYCLKLSQHLQIHYVFTIAQLKPNTDPDKKNFRLKPDLFQFISVTSDTNKINNYEIEKIFTFKKKPNAGYKIFKILKKFTVLKKSMEKSAWIWKCYKVIMGF